MGVYGPVKRPHSFVVADRGWRGAACACLQHTHGSSRSPTVPRTGVLVTHMHAHVSLPTPMQNIRPRRSVPSTTQTTTSRLRTPRARAMRLCMQVPGRAAACIWPLRTTTSQLPLKRVCDHTHTRARACACAHRYPAVPQRVIDRLDAIMSALVHCKGPACRNPYAALHPGQPVFDLKAVRRRTCVRGSTWVARV